MQSSSEKVRQMYVQSWEKMEVKLGENGGKVGRKWMQSWEKMEAKLGENQTKVGSDKLCNKSNELF